MKYIDLHCDTFMALYQGVRAGNLKKSENQVDLDKLYKGQCLMQCFAMFLDLKKTDQPFQTCMKMIDLYDKEMLENSNLITPILSFDDLKQCVSNQKMASFLTIEEGGVLESSLEKLDILYRRGVRMICLNWNYSNGIGNPNILNIKNGDIDYNKRNMIEGLTKFGFELVHRMNQLGIIVDVSHLSDKGFWDVINCSSKPIVASHSNVRSCCNHSRNLTDEMIKALAANRGVMGINFCSSFLNDTPALGQNTIEECIRHMQYVKNLVGVEVLAIGSDFDGINPNIQMKDCSMMQILFEKMVAAGFKHDEIEKISHLNFLRVMKENLIA